MKCSIFFFSLEACKSYKSLETLEFSIFINLLLCCCCFFLFFSGSSIVVLRHSQTSPGGQLSPDTRHQSIYHTNQELPVGWTHDWMVTKVTQCNTLEDSLKDSMEPYLSRPQLSNRSDYSNACSYCALNGSFIGSVLLY